FTRAGIGSVNRTGGTAGVVNLTGTLTNAGTLTLDTASNGLGTVNLVGGTINGGIIATANSAILSSNSSSRTLSGVTFAAGAQATFTSSDITVTGGLTVNGKLQVLGNGSGHGLLINGTQTLGGSGEVVLNNDLIRLNQAGMTLTVGPSLLVHGGG